MPARLLVLLVLLAVAAAGEGPHALWIRKLRSGDAGEQERAARVLANLGTPALDGLKAEADAAADEAYRKRVLGVIARIEAREPNGLRFGAGMPKMKLTLDLVSTPAFRYAVTVRNRTLKPVVLWPYLRLRVLDARSNELKPARRQGRWGLRRSECYLEDVPFVAIEPGKAWSFQESLARYLHDPDLITGWKVAAPGTYTLEFTYAYDRAAAKKRCDPKWKDLDDPARPWNRALEMKHTFTAKMRVQ